MKVIRPWRSSKWYSSSTTGLATGLLLRIETDLGRGALRSVATSLASFSRSPRMKPPRATACVIRFEGSRIWNASLPRGGRRARPGRPPGPSAGPHRPSGRRRGPDRRWRHPGPSRRRRLSRDPGPRGAGPIGCRRRGRRSRRLIRRVARFGRPALRDRRRRRRGRRGRHGGRGRRGARLPAELDMDGDRHDRNGDARQLDAGAAPDRGRRTRSGSDRRSRGI